MTRHITRGQMSSEEARDASERRERHGRAGAASSRAETFYALQQRAGNQAVSTFVQRQVRRYREPRELGGRTFRVVTGITAKRRWAKPTGFLKFDVGHYWTEISPSESYGWYPKYLRSGGDALWGVPGQLNRADGMSSGSATQDAHHGDSADMTFHPVVTTRDNEEAIKRKIRTFARGYSKTYAIGPRGTDCQEFQDELLEAVGLREPTVVEASTVTAPGA